MHAVKVTITNLGPPQGHLISRAWVGFHSGEYRTFESDKPASAALRQMAEDANPAGLTNAFVAAGVGLVQGTLYGSDDVLDDTAPGNSISATFVLDGRQASSRYFSYAAMIIPSNDAFIGNEDPMAHPIFDASGCFVGADITVTGQQVFDAGSEVNDEAPLNSAGGAPPPLFFRGTGVPENGVIHPHPGPSEGGAFLSNPAFANARYTGVNYQVARIVVAELS